MRIAVHLSRGRRSWWRTSSRPRKNPFFSAVEKEQTSDDYFLESGDKIRFFFEQDAFDDDGALRQDKFNSINKIGHAMHDLDPVFDAFSRQAGLAEIAGDAGLTEPLLLQSMIIFKPPRIGGEVVWHQDTTFLHTEPPRILGMWFALEDATEGNGCLWGLPGSHRRGLKLRYLRAPGGGVQTITDDDTAWPDSEFVPFEVKRELLLYLMVCCPMAAPPTAPRSRVTPIRFT